MVDFRTMTGAAVTRGRLCGCPGGIFYNINSLNDYRVFNVQKNIVIANTSIINTHTKQSHFHQPPPSIFIECFTVVSLKFLSINFRGLNKIIFSKYVNLWSIILRVAYEFRNCTLMNALLCGSSK